MMLLLLCKFIIYRYKAHNSNVNAQNSVESSALYAAFLLFTALIIKLPETATLTFPIDPTSLSTLISVSFYQICLQTVTPWIVAKCSLFRDWLLQWSLLD